MLIEQQIAARQERAAAAPLKILERPATGPYGDYSVKSASGRAYRVAIPGGLGFLRIIAHALISRLIRWEPASTSRRCFCGCGSAIRRPWKSRSSSAHALPSCLSTGIRSR